MQKNNTLTLALVYLLSTLKTKTKNTRHHITDTNIDADTAGGAGSGNGKPALPAAAVSSIAATQPTQRSGASLRSTLYHPPIHYSQSCCMHVLSLLLLLCRPI